MYLDYTMLPSDLAKDYDVTFEEKETLFVKRWKPDALQVRPGFELRLNLATAIADCQANLNSGCNFFI